MGAFEVNLSCELLVLPMGQGERCARVTLPCLTSLFTLVSNYTHGLVLKEEAGSKCVYLKYHVLSQMSIKLQPQMSLVANTK